MKHVLLSRRCRLVALSVRFSCTRFIVFFWTINSHRPAVLADRNIPDSSEANPEHTEVHHGTAERGPKMRDNSADRPMPHVRYRGFEGTPGGRRLRIFRQAKWTGVVTRRILRATKRVISPRRSGDLCQSTRRCRLNQDGWFSFAIRRLTAKLGSRRVPHSAYSSALADRISVKEPLGLC
jgi:hypothetical protein